MDDFLTESQCMPNLNTTTVAGRVSDVSTDSRGYTRFTVVYQKTWPEGGHSEIPIPCVTKGGRLAWMESGEIVLNKGELQRRIAQRQPVAEERAPAWRPPRVYKIMAAWGR